MRPRDGSRIPGPALVASDALYLRQCCFRTEDHGALARQHAAVAVSESDVAARHLALAALSANLPYRFDHHEETVHAGVTIREAAAARVDRELAAGSDRAALHKASALTLGT